MYRMCVRLFIYLQIACRRGDVQPSNRTAYFSFASPNKKLERTKMSAFARVISFLQRNSLFSPTLRLFYTCMGLCNVKNSKVVNERNRKLPLIIVTKCFCSQERHGDKKSNYICDKIPTTKSQKLNNNFLRDDKLLLYMESRSKNRWNKSHPFCLKDTE